MIHQSVVEKEDTSKMILISVRSVELSIKIFEIDDPVLFVLFSLCARRQCNVNHLFDQSFVFDDLLARS